MASQEIFTDVCPIHKSPTYSCPSDCPNGADKKNQSPGNLNEDADEKFPSKELKPIPRLVTHETSPHLETEAMQILKSQWERFWRLRHTERNTESTDNPALLKDGALLHNLRYDIDTFTKILKSGILLGYIDKETRAEDAETHYCADFFVNQGDKTIAEFIEFAYGNERNTGVVRIKRMESYGCPREQNNNISIVVDPTKPELAEMLKYSATGFDTSGLQNFPVHFSYGPEKPDIAKRHLAILVGIPANYISSLVVGGMLANDLEKISNLKALIESTGLDIVILNCKGERL